MQNHWTIKLGHCDLSVLNGQRSGNNEKEVLKYAECRDMSKNHRTNEIRSH